MNDLQTLKELHAGLTDLQLIIGRITTKQIRQSGKITDNEKNILRKNLLSVFSQIEYYLEATIEPTDIKNVKEIVIGSREDLSDSNYNKIQIFNNILKIISNDPVNQDQPLSELIATALLFTDKTFKQIKELG